MNYEELINTATDVGSALLTNGAEIYRVEESMQRIFQAYSVPSEIFAIPTCIYVTITTEDGKPITKIKRLYRRNTNLDRVEQLNALCRQICREKPGFKEIRRELQKINQRPDYGFPAQMLAFSLIAFSFTLFYGGNLPDALIAAICGAVMKIIVFWLERFHVNNFFINILASCAGAAIAFIALQFNMGLNPDKIIIGALMNLVPGIAITSFMRDLIAGDLIAGLIRFTESLLVATAIAIGAGIALAAVRTLWGV